MCEQINGNYRFVHPFVRPYLNPAWKVGVVFCGGHMAVYISSKKNYFNTLAAHFVCIYEILGDRFARNT